MDKTLDTVASNVSSAFFRAAPGRASAALPFTALLRAHVFVRHLLVSKSSSSISPSRSGERTGACVHASSPETSPRKRLALGDVIRSSDKPSDPLGVPPPHPAANPLGQSRRDEVAVGLTGTRAHG